MKTKLFLFVLAAIFTTLTIQAASNPVANAKDTAKHRINIRVNQDNMVVLRADLFKGEKRLNYILKVYNEKGDMVYVSTLLKKGPIYKSYDMSKLPEGKYNFTITKKLKPIYSKEVLKNSSPELNSNEAPLLVEEL